MLLTKITLVKKISIKIFLASATLVEVLSKQGLVFVQILSAAVYKNPTELSFFGKSQVMNKYLMLIL